MKTEILVIDFEPRSREATQRLLAEQDYAVVAVSSAEELEKLLAEPANLPAYVLLEPLLPGTDGFQVCRTLKKTKVRGGSIPKVLMGARILSGPRYRGLAHSAGADFFYRRPEENDKALQRLAEMIGQEAMESGSAGSQALARARVSAAVSVSQVVAQDAGPDSMPAAQGGVADSLHEQETATARPRNSTGGQKEQEVFESVAEQAIDRALTGAIHFSGGEEPLPTLMDIPIPPAPSSREAPPPATPESADEEKPQPGSDPPAASAGEAAEAPDEIDLRLPTGAVEPDAETGAGALEVSGEPSPVQGAMAPASPESPGEDGSSNAGSDSAAKPPPDAQPSAEQVLDNILERALGGPGPRLEPRDTEVSDEDLAGLDEMFTGRTAVVSKKLEGMDRGTAELLSTLEELESTVPESHVGGATATGEDWTETGVSLGPEVETSIPLKPPPRPKDEESLEEVLSSIPTPIAEPVEPDQQESEAFASGSLAQSGAVSGAVPRPAKASTEPRVFVSAPAQRRVPLVALLAVAAVALAAVLAFWALRGPVESPLPGATGDPVAESAATQPATEMGGDETEPAATTGEPAPESPDSAAALSSSTEPERVPTVGPRDSGGHAAEGPVATAAPSAPAERAETAPAILAEPPAPTSQVANKKKVTRDRPTPPAPTPNSAEPHRAVAERAPALAPVAIPEMNIEAPAEPVFSADPVADSSALGAVLSDTELTAEAAPPPKISPLVPGINGVSSPELISTSRVEPVYPSTAQRMGVSGKVILQIVVKRDGTVSQPKVLAEPGGNYGFGDAAKAAVVQWRYRPAMRKGRPVDAYLTVNIVFSR